MSQPAPSKFALYRARKGGAGMKMVCIWVPNLDLPDVEQRVAREMAILRDAPEQAETMAFLEGIEREDVWPA